jgi:hypothetical protein
MIKKNNQKRSYYYIDNFKKNLKCRNNILTSLRSLDHFGIWGSYKWTCIINRRENETNKISFFWNGFYNDLLYSYTEFLRIFSKKLWMRLWVSRYYLGGKYSTFSTLISLVNTMYILVCRILLHPEGWEIRKSVIFNLQKCRNPIFRRR